MKLVRIIKYWSDLDLLKQTPKKGGVWRDFRFIIDEPGVADYVVVHGHVGLDWKRKVEVICPPGNIWLILGEPPHEWGKAWNNAQNIYSRVFTTDPSQTSPRHIKGHAMLPWRVERSFDELVGSECPHKPFNLSWVTSNTQVTAGHQRRMAFYERIRSMPELNMFGRGFMPIEDKWDGLAAYRYSIAFENFSNSLYWTEKVMDCFLAWTMPIYFGCTDLANFFPSRSFIQLDPECADPVGYLRQTIASDIREKNLDAISEARRRVLYDYNLFELLAKQIQSDIVAQKADRPCRIVLSDTAPPMWKQFYGAGRACLGSLRRRLTR